ncbi:phage portal protein [Haloarcula sp. 1CSR25-25]|uniref:phage portal protein n=1 Tax=Haloarcula sp. 1CSR25-25 TaxID=2862545 RepID=UPI0028945036|nr:phage portal protein [Haloarcula sp. 1CSR25-25]MDT3434697.1 phage portal protein [Haloarcula sp. 1CSR25-25]
MSSGDTEIARTIGGDESNGSAWQNLQSTDYTDRETANATSSQQHDPDDPHDQTDYYEPPYPPTNLALLLERSETHARCVDAKAQGVAGHGFDIVPHEEAVDEDSDSEPPGEDTVREFWFGDDSTFQLGVDAQPATPSQVIENGWTDYESIGWLAIEVLANDMTGDPTGLAHLPAHTIRKRSDAPGFVQIDPDSNIIEGYFAPAGARYGDDQTFIDADDGTVGGSIADVDTPANELIVYRNYSALAPHYGTPDIIPAMETLAGDVAARTYNRRFFENDGVPRFAVIVEGGELTDAAWAELEEKFAELKDNDEAHRGVILEAVSGIKNSFEDAHDVSLRIEPLTVGVDEDASFTEYRRENEHDILKAHEVPPVVANRTERINRANADAQRRRFANETIRPKQEKFAAHLYRLIHQTMLDVDGWTIEFALQGGESEMRQAEINKLRIEGTAGVITVDEAREEVGKEPLGAPEGDLLVAELSQTGPAGGSGAPSSGSGEGGDVQAARRDQRAADLGYSLTDRADSDD